MLGWRAAAATSIGTSHVKNGTLCQDSHSCTVVNSEGSQLLLVICSDGAGSATRSDIGAEIACAEILERFTTSIATNSGIEGITRTEVEAWIVDLSKTISARAESEGLSARDFACTLIACAVSETHAVYFQIGDGAIVVRSKKESEWCYVFWPMHGEYLNTTVFVTDPNAVELLQFESNADEIMEVSAFTDGIESLVLHYGTQSVHGHFFESVMKPVAGLAEPGVSEALSMQLASYLSSDHICSRTDDDKTLVLATRADAVS